MRGRRTSAGIAILLAGFLLPAYVSAQSGGELHSNSFWVRMFVINSGCTNYLEQTSTSFIANGCLGEIGQVHSSNNFQLLAGFCNQVHWFFTSDTTIAVPPDIVINTALGFPAPNPASGAVSLGFAIKEGEVGSIRVYDLTGRLVCTVVEDLHGPMTRVVRWDLKDSYGREVAAGIYFAKLQTNSKELTRRIVLLGR